MENFKKRIGKKSFADFIKEEVKEISEKGISFEPEALKSLV